MKGAAQIFFWGWNADYPDAENFLFLFYGPNGKVKNEGENAANYESEAFDAAFREMRFLEDGPRRAELIDRMIRILQKDAPILFGYFPPGAAAYHAWWGMLSLPAWCRTAFSISRSMKRPGSSA